MKKSTLRYAVLFLTFCFAACGGAGSSTNAGSNASDSVYDPAIQSPGGNLSGAIPSVPGLTAFRFDPGSLGQGGGSSDPFHPLEPAAYKITPPSGATNCNIEVDGATFPVFTYQGDLITSFSSSTSQVALTCDQGLHFSVSFSNGNILQEAPLMLVEQELPNLGLVVLRAKSQVDADLIKSHQHILIAWDDAGVSLPMVIPSVGNHFEGDLSLWSAGTYDRYDAYQIEGDGPSVWRYRSSEVVTGGGGTTGGAGIP